METQWSGLIGFNPEVRFGKAIILGTRITVADVLSWLASGMQIHEIIEDFPELSKEQILAALAFAANQERNTKIVAA